MSHVSVINNISVPEGMEEEAEKVRSVYVNYFKAQLGFVESKFYKSLNRNEDGSLNYINIVVWDSRESFEKVVNKGFGSEYGENQDGMRVLGKGFPEPIKVSPGQFELLEENA